MKIFRELTINEKIEKAHTVTLYHEKLQLVCTL